MSETQPPEMFAKAVCAAYDAAGITYTYLPERFAIHSETGYLLLGNFFDEYQNLSEPEPQQAVIDRLLRLAQSPPSTLPTDWAEAEGNILARVRVLSYYTRARLQLAQLDRDAPDPSFIHAPFAPGMAIEAVYDLPLRILPIGPKQVEAWQQDTATLIATGVRNLKAINPNPFTTIADGVFIANTGDSYDSSRMCLIDDIKALPLQGAPLAIAPIRDALIICGSEHPDGRAVALQVIQSQLEAQRRESFEPYILRDGGWQRWTPDPSDPQAEPWVLLCQQYLAGEYSLLKEMLDALHGDEGPYVAPFKVIRSKEGEILSYTNWPQSEGGWMPQANLVALTDIETMNTILAPWSVIADRPELERVPNIDPPLWSVASAPDSAMLKTVSARLNDPN
ncbi:MAG: hypothetical protein AAFX99_21565 [Myxococcota bacterium]